MKRRVLSILILGANLLNVAAQNMTSSPVSMFGLGELSTGEGGIYSGLGGVGIALRGENVINSANPASLTGLLPQYFFRFGCQRVLSEIFTVRSEQSFSEW